MGTAHRTDIIAALPRVLTEWLTEHADELDQGGEIKSHLLTKLADGGVFKAGVPSQWGGDGSQVSVAVSTIAALARFSLTAAFVAWGHRTLIEYLIQAKNPSLAERWLPSLLNGKIAGATALSNAMKYLSGIENIQINASPTDNGWTLNGKLFWVTNLAPQGFLVAAIVATEQGEPFIALLENNTTGLTRSDDLNLLALRGSSTAALQLDDVALPTTHIIDINALEFCPRIRPRFLGLQCGMSIGLIRASLDKVQQRASRSDGDYLLPVLNTLEHSYQSLSQRLLYGLNENHFSQQATNLFQLRIDLADLVQKAANLELEASGGGAYLLDYATGFARRWHEAAFIPVVTPSVSQLRGELLKHRAQKT